MLDPAESPTPGLRPNRASLTRVKILLVVVFCSLSVGFLKAVPLFSFRFLSGRLLRSGEGGVEPLVRVKLFNRQTLLKEEDYLGP